MTRRTGGAGGAGVLGLVVTHGARAARVQTVMGPRARPALSLALTLVRGPGLHRSEGSCGTNETRVLNIVLTSEIITLSSNTHLGFLGLVTPS